jgi:glycosyltransferase involved in cell wall biosynthesis
MKIIQVVHGFPPHSIGGSEIYTHSLSTELSKQDEVFVFYRSATSGQPEYCTQATESGALTLLSVNNTLKYCDSFEKTYNNHSISPSFGSFLDEVKPDIVHIQHLANLSATFIEEAKLRQIPVIFTLHDFWLFCHLGQLLKLDLTICDGPQESECVRCIPPQAVVRNTYDTALRILKKSGALFHNRVIQEALRKAFHRHYTKFSALLHRGGNDQIKNRVICIERMCSLVDLFIAPSNFVRKKFIEFGVSKEKIIHLPNGFNLDLFKDISRPPSEKIRFGYIGTFIPSKGIHVLLEAFNRINSDKVELRIHGTPMSYHQGFIDYPAYLRSLARRDNVRWFGKYNNYNIAKILSEIDVLVVPSIWYENAPLTIHEAFMTSVPVITANIGGMKEHVCDNRNGLLFQAGKSGDLAAKMQKILDNPGLLDLLRNGIKPVTPIASHAREIRRLYDSVI